MGGGNRARRIPRSTERKKVGTRQAKKRLLVVTEGSKTEPQYLALLRPYCQAFLIEIELIDEPSTSPRELVDRACSERARSIKQQDKTGDPNSLIEEVWCLFDVDEHPYLKESIQKANDHGVRVGVSNPSFELWILLHFQNQTAHVSRHDVLKLVQAEIPGYNKSLPSIEPLEGRSSVAINRAKALETRHFGNGTEFPENNPSTTVWSLIESLKIEY